MHSFLLSPRVPGRAPGCRNRCADGCKRYFSVGGVSGCATVKCLEQMGSLEEDSGKTVGAASRQRKLWAVKCFMACGLRYVSHVAQ